MPLCVLAKLKGGVVALVSKGGVHFLVNSQCRAAEPRRAVTEPESRGVVCEAELEVAPCMLRFMSMFTPALAKSVNLFQKWGTKLMQNVGI